MRTKSRFMKSRILEELVNHFQGQKSKWLTELYQTEQLKKRVKKRVSSLKPEKTAHPFEFYNKDNCEGKKVLEGIYYQHDDLRKDPGHPNDKIRSFKYWP